MSLAAASRSGRCVREPAGNEKAYGHYHHAQHDVACAHALLGHPDEACRWLADAARNGYPSATHFALDPLLATLHGNERFERLTEDLRADQARHLRLYEKLRSEADSPTG